AEAQKSGLVFSYDNGTMLTVSAQKALNQSRAAETLDFSVTIPTDIKKEWFCEADDFLIRFNGEYKPIASVVYPETIQVECHWSSLGRPTDSYIATVPVNLGAHKAVPADHDDYVYKQRDIVCDGITYRLITEWFYSPGANGAKHEEVIDCYPINTGYAETVPVETYHSNKATTKYITVDAPVNLGKPLDVPADSYDLSGSYEYTKRTVTHNGITYCVVICTTITGGVVFHESVFDCYPVDAAIKQGNSLTSGAFRVSEENLVVTVSNLENLSAGDEYTYETWLWVKENIDVDAWTKSITDDCTYSAVPGGYEIRYDVFKGVNGGGATPYIKVSIHVVKKN
ncbi:MAG: hypothetical protein HUK08_09530, partial [Bacteroidaceae bacterium]|nr:hypothetical protein [Bacteroidaceae bacterium]